MEKKLKIDLQMFTDGDDTQNENSDSTDGNTGEQTSSNDGGNDGGEKRFTQKQLDAIVEERLKREREKQERENDVNDDNKNKDLKTLVNEKKENQVIEDLRKQVVELQSRSNRQEVIESYIEAKLPCVDKFKEIASVFTSIESVEERANTLYKFETFIKEVIKDIKAENLKGELPSAASNQSEYTEKNNPFVDENLTEMLLLISKDKALAMELSKKAKTFDKYKYLFE